MGEGVVILQICDICGHKLEVKSVELLNDCKNGNTFFDLLVSCPTEGCLNSFPNVKAYRFSERNKIFDGNVSDFNRCARSREIVLKV